MLTLKEQREALNDAIGYWSERADQATSYKEESNCTKHRARWEKKLAELSNEIAETKKYLEQKQISLEAAIDHWTDMSNQTIKYSPSVIDGFKSHQKNSEVMLAKINKLLAEHGG